MARIGTGVPMVARSAELERLRATLRHAADGAAAAVLISGDAGVGKSRLLEEIVHLADDYTVLSGRCVDVGATGLPYLPFTEILTAIPDHATARPALGRLLPSAGRPSIAGYPETAVAPASDATTSATDSADGPISPPLYSRLTIDPFAAGARNERDVGTLQLFDAMLSTLVELAAERPVLLTIEDLHWADSSTRSLFSYLLARLPQQRIVVLATYRSDDLHRRHPLRPMLAELFRLPIVTRMDLGPLQQSDSERFVTELGEHGLSTDVVRDIVQRSEGNPFFAEELVVAANEQGDSKRLPWTLSEVLLTRTERLGAATQQLVRAAAVAGRRVHNSRLTGILRQTAPELHEPEFEQALREALTHHVLIAANLDGQPAYAFRHALMAEAVYADLLPSERVRLHTAYVQQLARETSTPGAAAELAYHALQSNDLARALAASVDAAVEATRAGAPAEALRHLEQALQLFNAVDDPELCCGRDERWLLGRAREAAAGTGDPERAIAYGRNEVRAADTGDSGTPGDPDPLVRADARQHLARHLLSVDGYEQEAMRVVDEAWELIRDREPDEVHPLVLSVRAELQRLYDRSENPVPARDSAEEAVRIARIVGSRGAEADALITLATMDSRRGNVDEACERLQVARGRAAEAGALAVELRALSRHSMYRLEQGRLSDAARVIEDGLRRAEQHGLSSLSPSISMRLLRATLAYLTGDFDAALRDADSSGPESDLTSAVLCSTGLVVWVARGEFETAENAIARFRGQGYGDVVVATTSAASGAEMECWRSRPEAAVDAIEEGLRASRELSMGQEQLSGIKLATHAIAAYADLAYRARQRRDPDAESVAVRAGEGMLAYAENLAETVVPGTGLLGPEGRAWLQRGRAETTRLRGDSDPDTWRETIRTFGYGHVYEQALARRRLAEGLLDRGDREAAGSELSEALGVADRIGAVPLATALRQLAQRARITPGRSDEPARDVRAADVLTPRELAVLREVAGGGTNKQIGAALYISEKTVSVHLSRVMTKLEASSRTEAVTMAYRRGLL